MKKRPVTLLVFGAILSLFLFQRYVVDPGREALREKLESDSATLDKYQRVLRSPVSEADVAKLQELIQKQETRLLKETSVFLASAKMQSRVTEIAAKAGLNLSTLRAVDPAAMGSYKAITVYFEASGSIKQISEFLKDIENDAILMKCDKLSVNVTNLQTPKELRVKIQISGLMKA